MPDDDTGRGTRLLAVPELEAAARVAAAAVLSSTERRPLAPAGKRSTHVARM
jgi:hypothetical protein